jgi:hypothetical protein
MSVSGDAAGDSLLPMRETAHPTFKDKDPQQPRIEKCKRQPGIKKRQNDLLCLNIWNIS